MIVDALVLADPYLHMSQMIKDPKEYINLTDGILREIERSKNPLLAASQKILKRIRDRDIYKFVDEYHYGHEEARLMGKHRSNEIASKIVGHQVDGMEFDQDDVIVEILKVNYAMKDKNPVDSIKFYSKYDCESASPISREKISALIPDFYQDTVCRVFSKNPEKVKAIQEAFRAYLSHETHHNSVAKKRPFNELSRSSTLPLSSRNGSRSPPWNSSLTFPVAFPASPRKRTLPSSMTTSPDKRF